MVVKAVAGEYANIHQIVANSASPHDFALRPSDLKKINQADLLFGWGILRNVFRKTVRKCR